MDGIIMIVMKDGSDLQGLLNHVNAEMLELQQEYMNLEQENMDKEDENARLLQQLLLAREETCKEVDAERLRAWKENKAFQYDLAEENAKLRKKLSEKHDDNCRLQRQLAEQHNILMDAYKSLEDLELSTLSANSRMSNAEVKVDDLAEENRILLSKLRYLDTLQRVEKFEEAYESPTPKEFSGEELSMLCRMDSLEQQLEDLRRDQKGVGWYRDRHGRWREES
jgi:hypothetical protein